MSENNNITIDAAQIEWFIEKTNIKISDMNYTLREIKEKSPVSHELVCDYLNFAKNIAEVFSGELEYLSTLIAELEQYKDDNVSLDNDSKFEDV